MECMDKKNMYPLDKRDDTLSFLNIFFLSMTIILVDIMKNDNQILDVHMICLHVDILMHIKNNMSSYILTYVWTHATQSIHLLYI